MYNPTMNTNSQRMTYDQVVDKIQREYYSIPYPKLRTLAKESGFVQVRYGERCKYTLVKFLTETKFSKEFNEMTHTMKLPGFSTEWVDTVWFKPTPFMELFAVQDYCQERELGYTTKPLNVTEIANKFREKNSWAPKEVLDNICDTFQYEYERWASVCYRKPPLSDCEDDEPDDPPPRFRENPNRISVHYDMSPATIDMDTKELQGPDGMSNECGYHPHQPPQFNGTLYRCRWLFEEKGIFFHEEVVKIDKPGEHTFTWPWNNV